MINFLTIGRKDFIRESTIGSISWESKRTNRWGARQSYGRRSQMYSVKTTNPGSFTGDIQF